MIEFSQKREVGEFRKRYKWMALFVLLVFGLLLVRVIMLQVFEYEQWASAARNNITKTLKLPATRGMMRDCKGRVVAANRPAYNVFVTPQLLAMPQDLERIARLIGLGVEEQADLEERLNAIVGVRRTHQIEVLEDIRRDQLAALETHQASFAGIDIVTVPVRTYPYGALGSHVVGYLNEVNQHDLERTKAYQPGDMIGRTGLEKQFEVDLRGTTGLKRSIVDARGRLPGAGGLRAETLHAPQPGHDLELTVDMALMELLDQSFKDYPAGAAAVIDVRNGAVRALYSKPSYDPNEMSVGIDSDRYAALLEDPHRPLSDKALYETYFPGSTFKPFTALAAMSQGELHGWERYECPGFYQVGRQRFRCNGRHGAVDLHEALVRSCNVFFWKVAEELGLEPINAMASEFGFGEYSETGLNTEAKGFLASREWYTKTFGRFRPGYTLNTAIGQGNTRVTVLQVALAYAALANGGSLYRPRLVEAVRTADGKLLRRFEPVVRRQIEIDASYLEQVRLALTGVVNEKKGTAYSARQEKGVLVAGKTGTAQVAGRASKQGSAFYVDRSHAWFAAYAPADNPQLAIAVLVEHGGAGSKTAAPIATRVLDAYLARAEAVDGDR